MAFHLIKFFKQFMTRKHVTLNVPAIRTICVYAQLFPIVVWKKEMEKKHKSAKHREKLTICVELSVVVVAHSAPNWLIHTYANEEWTRARRGYLFAITFWLTRASVLVLSPLSRRRFAFFQWWWRRRWWRRHTSCECTREMIRKLKWKNLVRHQCAPSHSKLLVVSSEDTRAVLDVVFSNSTLTVCAHLNKKYFNDDGDDRARNARMWCIRYVWD